MQYRTIGREYAQHDSIKHAALQYVDGDITTNTVEGVFAIFKRGLMGIYHNISKQHLPKYLAEYEFRYNARHMNDGDRTVLAIQSAEGKRLMYRTPSP